MKRQLLLTVASAGLLAFAIAAPRAAGQDCATAVAFDTVTSNFISPDILIDVRPDLSNPGARAMAMGGAFISTADDATSVIANPAGLGSVVKPTINLEARLSQDVQAQRYGASGLLSTDPNTAVYSTTSKSWVPPFASFVLPVTDRLVLGAFYQQVYNGGELSRQPDRSAGPCFDTRDPLGRPRRVYVAGNSVSGKEKLSRAGISAAYRIGSSTSLGVTVFGANESREQDLQVYPSQGQSFFTSAYHASASGWKPGFIFGFQWVASQNVKIGLSGSPTVVMKEADYTVGTTVVTSFQNKMVLPGRWGAGVTYSPSTKFSLAVEGVLVQSSDVKKNFNYAAAQQSGKAFVEGNWKQDDHFELRLGGEYAITQTRTTVFTARLGTWMETASNLRYSPAGVTDETKVIDDMLMIYFPDKSDKTAIHVTGGLGLLASKQWQVDAAFDYELNRDKVFRGSLLLGYTFN